MTAIELAFNIDAKNKPKNQQIDELIDYISHVNNNIQKDKQGHFSTFYQLELSAAKNKLKELVA
jgi:hypothetical protein